MNAGVGLDWFREMLWTALLAAGPSVMTVVIVGFAVAIIQAATQVNDQAIAFGPKAGAVVLALVVGGPFMLQELADFTRNAISAMANITP
ncbi:MAG: flagellar biosynthetic protein FliQ [Myxococcota bacterium]